MAPDFCKDLPASRRDNTTSINSSLPGHSFPEKIPDDVIFNVLSRLPAKSVIQFRSVCKAWFTMLSSQRFIDAHLESSMARRLALLIVPTEYHRSEERGWKAASWLGFYSYKGVDTAELVHGEHVPGGFEELQRPLHCDGLVLACSHRGREVMICNPATREFMCLPKGQQSYGAGNTYGFGRDPRSNRYKVVRIFTERIDQKSTRARCVAAVLTLGTNVWRRLGDPPGLIGGAPAVHVRGSIYFNVRFPKAVILRLNLTKEKFRKMPGPPCKGTGYIGLTQLEGELCVISIAKPCEAIQLWACPDATGDMPEWTLRYTVRIPQGVSGLPKVEFHGKDLLIVGNRKVYRHIIEAEETREVDVVALEDLLYYQPESNTYQAYSGENVDFRTVGYTESLVRIRGGHNSSEMQPVLSRQLVPIVDHASNLISKGWQKISELWMATKHK